MKCNTPQPVWKLKNWNSLWSIYEKKPTHHAQRMQAVPKSCVCFISELLGRYKFVIYTAPLCSIHLNTILLAHHWSIKSLYFGFLFQVPASPNYSLVLYYAADRPVKDNSLLGQFVNGTDIFRDSRLKLIPSIKEVT